MACPFLDPNMLARLPAEKREEMKDMYHRMKKEQDIKIDIKEDDYDNVSPEQMMMGMAGATASTTGCPIMGGGTTSTESSSGGVPMMDSM